jgi:hypothetical protein
VVSFTPQLLYPQVNSPQYPLDRRLGEPQSCSGCGGEEKNSQPPLTKLNGIKILSTECFSKEKILPFKKHNFSHISKKKKHTKRQLDITGKSLPKRQ